MKLFQYIQGIRKGKEINRLEKEAMKDPFLADAIEGFDKVKSENHHLRIDKMCAKISKKTQSEKRPVLRYWSIAASILLIIGFGGYFLLNENRLNMDFAPMQSYVHEEQIKVDEEHIKSEETPQSARSEMKEQAEKPAMSNQVPVNRNQPRNVIHDEKQIETAALQESEIVMPDTMLSIENKALADMSSADMADKEEEDNKRLAFTGEQEVKVRGIVTDLEGNPISGATIIYTGTNKGVVSDTAGHFELPESEDNKIQVNYLGYESVNLVADTGKTMLVAMKENADVLNEVVVVAFGKQKKSSTVAAVSSVKNEEINPQPVIGEKEYKKYLEENIIKPQSGKCKGKKGRVRLKFSVDEAGRPINIRVEKSLCPEADNEAIRLITAGSDWTPGNREVGIDVKF
jgi:TonB family protein